MSTNPLAATRPAAAATLAVRRLQLTDFRNYGTLRLAPEASSVVLTGPNGAGKTNLLEALSLLVPGRGLRRAKIAALARREAGDGVWAVAVGVQTPDGMVEVGIGRDPKAIKGGRDRRLLRINGRDPKSQATLGDVLHATWLTPGDGPPLPGRGVGTAPLPGSARLRLRSRPRHPARRLQPRHARAQPPPSGRGCRSRLARRA